MKSDLVAVLGMGMRVDRWGEDPSTHLFGDLGHNFDGNQTEAYYYNLTLETVRNLDPYCILDLRMGLDHPTGWVLVMVAVAHNMVLDLTTDLEGLDFVLGIGAGTAHNLNLILEAAPN